ncbi:GAF domain-containing sensor histidine kinase [Alkalinema pantanalense CENA528]|uniref:sensor histidine kinase n=1 Tax=Alkalinema pantanalense TaxID=1620705 RepID=UPI003D6F862F
MRFDRFQLWQWLSSVWRFGQNPVRSTHLEIAQILAGLGSWQIYDLGSSQETLQWSEPLYRLLDIPVEVPPSHACYLAQVHPDDRDRVAQVHQRWRDMQQLEELEYRLVHQDGRERWVREQITVDCAHQSGVLQMTGIVQDITADYQQAEYNRLLTETSQRIRQSLQVEEILQTAVAEIRRLLGVDRAFIAQVNPQGCGYIAAESNDPAWGSIAEEGFPSEVIAELQTVYRQRGTIVHHSPTDQPSKGFLHYLYCKYEVKAGISTPIAISGATMGLLAVHQCKGSRQWNTREIQLLEQLAAQIGIALQQGYLHRQAQETAIALEQQVKERTQQLEQQMEVLQLLNQQQERLIHAISHDLQTPILGMVMVLQRLAKQTEQPLSSTMLNLMLDSSQRQLSLLKSLQEEAATSQPLLQLDRQPTQLTGVIHRTLEDLQPLLRESDIQVSTRFQDFLPTVAVDSSYIQQVVRHLITNVVQHNLPGLQITIEVGLDDGMDRTPPLSNRWHGGDREASGRNQHPWQHAPCLYCRVQDNGVGLQPEQIALMFTKPYLRSSHNRHITGLGLGLYLCHQAIKAHGGEIGVISKVEQGSIFWFTVPIPVCATSAIDLAS